MSVLLEVDHAVCSYAMRRTMGDLVARRPSRGARAVDDVSFHVRRGELVALVGESGAGKTSIVRGILGMVPAESGAIRYEGEDVSTFGGARLRELRRRVQVVFQDPYESLDPRFRVRDTVSEPLIVHGAGDRAEREAKVRHALERVGLAPDAYLDRFPHQLSGGERQRVAIAAALVLEPKLLIADEPVSMLDLSVRTAILDLLKDLQRDGLGILMVTHDLATAAHISDHMVVLYSGRVVESGPTAEVVGRPRHPYTRALLGAVPSKDPRLARPLTLLSGEPPDATRVPSGCRFHPRCPGARDRCAADEPDARPLGDTGHRVACHFADLTAPPTPSDPKERPC
ncbi:MAG TPA: ABC transporter ATP-binding protein [Baekduia sp.]|uniref:ABC transporter ATP-binding protein n=1 Tax=Baekduia sp. TaxID=2600305 RepID=UPI002D77DA50|nr:ABC transporter ATP-binding protein [Baekduia sp.]HET6509902.1 ABC transporter ATP-binding protein [Baekduia sp.]